MRVHRVLRLLIFKRSMEMKNILLAILVVAISGVNTSYAFKFDPFSKPDASGLYKKKFSEPIHERLTIKAINTAQIPDSLKTDTVFLSEVVRGVRWNDDPLSMAKKRPHEAFLYFKDSCQKPKKIDQSYDMYYRTHCGDMQFLHAMASKKNENAGATSEFINMWAEFSYRVAVGDIDKDLRFRSIGKKLEKHSAELFNDKMTYNGRYRMEWQPEWLFAADCNRSISLSEFPTKLKCKDVNNQYSEQTIQNIALGSLLHMLQDSFSSSHTLRENSILNTSQVSGAGKIERFGLYNAQDGRVHSRADLNTEDKYEHKDLSLNDLSARLIELVVDQRISGQDNWSEAKKTIEKAFEISNPSEEPDDIGYGATSKG